MKRLIDVNEWAGFFAVQDYITNIDGGIYTNNGEDYFLYHVAADAPRPDAGLWLLLPWDLDETFRNAGDDLFLTDVTTARRFCGTPSSRRSTWHTSRLARSRGSVAEMEESAAYAYDVYPASMAANAVGPIKAYVPTRLGSSRLRS